MRALVALRNNTDRVAIVGIRDREAFSTHAIIKETVAAIVDSSGVLSEAVLPNQQQGYVSYGSVTLTVLGELPEDWTPQTLLTVAERDPSYGSANVS